MRFGIAITFNFETSRSSAISPGDLPPTDLTPPVYVAGFTAIVLLGIPSLRGELSLSIVGKLANHGRGLPTRASASLALL